MCSDLLSCVFVKEILVKLDQILNDICVLIKKVIFQQAYQFFCMVITKAFSFFISLKKKKLRLIANTVQLLSRTNFAS